MNEGDTPLLHPEPGPRLQDLAMLESTRVNRTRIRYTTHCGIVIFDAVRDTVPQPLTHMLFKERGLWLVIHVIHEEHEHMAEYSNVMLAPLDIKALKWCLHLMENRDETE